MRCPRCEQPVRRFTLVDAQPEPVPVVVEPVPAIGTVRRLDVFGAAVETDPHPGGWVRHHCKEKP